MTARLRGVPRSRSRKTAGFSVVELLVTLALLALALALAADLLLGAARLLNATAVRARDPLPELAWRRLRHDLRGAGAATGGLSGPDWWHGPLHLTRPGGGSVEWSLDDGRLVRRVVPGPARPALAGVRQWRWRHAGPGLVEVELELVGPGAVVSDVVPPRVGAPTTTRRTLRQRTALRGRGRAGGGW